MKGKDSYFEGSPRETELALVTEKLEELKKVLPESEQALVELEIRKSRSSPSEETVNGEDLNKTIIERRKSLEELRKSVQQLEKRRGELEQQKNGN
jgi:hypothetical protein